MNEALYVIFTLGQGLWPAQYRMDGPKIRKASPVDRNHSHFIFVDNGTQQMFGTEIQFRAKLESAISEMKTDTGNSDEGTTSGPLVFHVM